MERNSRHLPELRPRTAQHALCCPAAVR
jgi:hypothetical protein